jgi:transposase
MPFVSKRAKLEVPAEEMDYLIQCSRSRTEGAAKVHRAKILLAYQQGESISKIAREMRTNRPRVERTVQKALEYGVRSALRDLPRRGRSPRISAEAKAWLVSVACTKPKDLGYAAETWTTRELARHVRKHCLESRYPSFISRDRIKDPYAQRCEATQDSVLFGTSRSRVRSKNGPSTPDL